MIRLFLNMLVYNGIPKIQKGFGANIKGHGKDVTRNVLRTLLYANTEHEVGSEGSGFTANIQVSKRYKTFRSLQTSQLNGRGWKRGLQT